MRTWDIIKKDGMSGNLIIIIFGLVLFEVISSLDNAIINAHVLKTLPERFRKIFLFWGILLGVFVVRGVLPFLIVWLAAPGFSFGEIWNLVWTSGSDIEVYLEKSKPLLLLGGPYLRTQHIEDKVHPLS